MKDIYYIGRDESSDIILQDDSNIISRTHAILRVCKRGKYTISDQSMNGSYVNGIRISSGVDVPISRTDIISFAHLVELDWSLIPNQAKKVRNIVLSIFGGVILIGTLCWGVLNYLDDNQRTPVENTTSLEGATDSLKTNVDTLKSIVSPIEDKKPVVKVTQKTSTVKVLKQEPVKKDVDKASEVENKKTIEDRDSVKEKKNINAIF